MIKIIVIGIVVLFLSGCVKEEIDTTVEEEIIKKINEREILNEVETEHHIKTKIKEGNDTYTIIRNKNG